MNFNLQGLLAFAVLACNCDNLRANMKNLANSFLTHGTMGECEVVYKVSPSMKKNKSNRYKGMRLYNAEPSKDEKENQE